jgi:hypothetical protein
MRMTTLLMMMSASRLCASDTPAKFFGPCRVSLAGSPTFRTVCMSEDLPTAGMNNRFHVVILYPPDMPHPFWLARIADYVRTEVTSGGNMRVSSAIIGGIEITPRDAALRDTMKQKGPTWEIRPQYVTLSTLPDGSLDLLIEEPCGSFNGKYGQESPSNPWRLDHFETLQRLSRAH